MTARQYQTTTISVAGGLSGLIALAQDSSSPADAPLPDEKTWHRLLTSITKDPSVLQGYQTLKYSGGNEVFRATLKWETPDTPHSIDVVCKKTISPGGFKSIVDTLRTSRARKNFERGLLLTSAGIATPTPLAAIECKKPRANWLITEFFPDLLDLDRIALAELPQLNHNEQRAKKNAIIQTTSELFVRLHTSKLFHRDLKASNVLIDGWNRQGDERAVLVDLDGLAKSSRSDTERWKPLVRLAASLLDYPTVSRGDFARCLKSYLASTHDDSSWRDHYHRLSIASARYAHESRKRKSNKLDGYT